jgi:hypothetical protein
VLSFQAASLGAFSDALVPAHPPPHTHTNTTPTPRDIESDRERARERERERAHTQGGGRERDLIRNGNLRSVMKYTNA